MAKRKVNKSAVIRALYAANPKLPVKHAVEQLAKEGIKVAASQVYFVLGGSRGKAKGKADRKRRAVAASEKARQKTGTAYPLSVITDAMAMAERAGGLANLKRLIEVLE